MKENGFKSTELGGRIDMLVHISSEGGRLFCGVVWEKVELCNVVILIPPI